MKQGAGGIIINRKGKYLLQLRDDKENIYNPGKWNFFGGSFENGEKPEEAMTRELLEETGMKLRGTPMFVFERSYGDFEDHMFEIFLDTDKGEIPCYEGQMGKFFTLEEIRDLETAPDVVEILERYEELKAPSSS